MANTSAWIVLGAGAAAIAWVNWYFFRAERRTLEASRSDRAQQVVVRVLGGYDPAVIRVRRGLPLKLVFDRQEDASCSDEVVIAAFGVKRYLPAFAKTEVDFTPNQTGTFDISCGMSMLHAKLIVED